MSSRQVIETTTIDSLEEGDFIHSHRLGLQLESELHNDEWVVVTKVERLEASCIVLSYVLLGVESTIECYPETLVKRRSELT